MRQRILQKIKEVDLESVQRQVRLCLIEDRGPLAVINNKLLRV